MIGKFITHSKEMKSIDVREGLSKKIPDHDPQVMKVALWTYKAGEEVKGHSHDVSDIGYVVRGKASMTIGDKPAEIIEAGDFFYTPAGTTHQMKVIETLDAVFFGVPEGTEHSHADGKPHSH